MKIDEIQYKGYTIEIWYSKELKNFYTTSAVGSTVSNGTVKDAIKSAKSIIKQFLETKINNYAELASMITESLIWTSDSDCYADEQVVEALVQNFLKGQKSELKAKQKTPQRIDATYVRLHNSIEDFECVDKETTCKVLAPFSVIVFLFVDGNELVADEFLDAVLKLDEEYNIYIVSAIQHFYNSTKD